MKLSDLLAPKQKSDLLDFKLNLPQHPEAIEKEKEELKKNIARENALADIIYFGSENWDDMRNK